MGSNPILSVKASVKGMLFLSGSDRFFYTLSRTGPVAENVCILTGKHSETDSNGIIYFLRLPELYKKESKMKQPEIGFYQKA